MSVRFWDYREEYASERGEILAAVDRAFSSGALILGPSVARFEAEFAAFCGARRAVALDNATNGIALGLRALGVRPGDEVVTVANTAVPTVAAVLQAGAVPRFADVDPDTALMDPASAEAAVTPRTRALLPVHLYGLCADLSALRPMAARRGLAVLEDCAQCHGASRGGRRAGADSDLAVFSFYPTKPLGAYGDGGIAVTNAPGLEAGLRSLRFYGMSEPGYAEEPGYNSRMDEVQAEILRFKLGRLEGYLRRRRELARRYDRALARTSLRLPRAPAGCEHAYALYPVRHPERDRIVAELKRRGVHAGLHYPHPLHLMRGFSHLGGRSGDLPRTEEHARTVFSLPLYPSLAEESQDEVCRALGEILGEPVEAQS